MPKLRDMPQLEVSRYGGDEDTKLLTNNGDWTPLGKSVSSTNIHPKKKGRPSTNKMTYDPLDNKTPFNCRWIKKSNTLQKGRAGDGGSRAATFASVGLAQSHAESLSNCVGFTHNKNTNLYWFHYNIDNIINKLNCQKKRNWQWCDLYILSPRGFVKSPIINQQSEIVSKYLNGNDESRDNKYDESAEDVCRWIKKSNTLQKGRAGDGGSRAATFASVGLAQSHAESLSNCVGFTHNKNINLYWFHYNIDNIINKQNCQKKRNWQWCDLYVREPLGLVKSAIIKTQPEIISKYLNVDDEKDKDKEDEEDGFIVNCDNDGLIDDPHMLPDNCGHFTVRKCLYSCCNFLNRCADTLSDLSDEVVEQRLVC